MNNIMQHHANNVDPVHIIPAHYSYTNTGDNLEQYHICYKINVYKLLTCGIC